jgi:hypothetical protein
MKKALLIVALVIVAFVAYSMWSTDREAHEILDGFTRAGVVREYVCDRTAPSITVGPEWAKLEPRTQRGVLSAVQMVCSTTANVDVRPAAAAGNGVR